MIDTQNPWAYIIGGLVVVFILLLVLQVVGKGKMGSSYINQCYIDIPDDCPLPQAKVV